MAALRVCVPVKLTLPNEYEVGNQAEAEAEAEVEAKSKTGQTGSTANFRLGDWAKRLIKSSSNAAGSYHQLPPPPPRPSS